MQYDRGQRPSRLRPAGEARAQLIERDLLLEVSRPEPAQQALVVRLEDLSRGAGARHYRPAFRRVALQTLGK